jgi:plastocyanin
MRRTSLALAVALAITFMAGCDHATESTQPDLAPVPTGIAMDRGGVVDRMVSMLDACDPTTFDAAVGPGTCLRNGGVTFDHFIAQLQKHGKAGAWAFDPPRIGAKVGQTLLATNRGGEVHTFTEVEEFGGGIVPDLNNLSGNPVPAPECLALGAGDFIPPGGTTSDEIEEPGVEHYQCCIHPWMRLTVVTR